MSAIASAVQIYLWVNAGLYFLLATWCSLKPRETSKAIGFLELNGGGRSEYLVIYGGMQLAFALIFGWLALNPLYYRAALVVSLLLYIPLVFFRVVSVLQNRPVEKVTLATAALEWGLLIWVVILWFIHR